VKLKQGYCLECNDGKLKDVISGKCKTHYWARVRKKSAEKNKGKVKPRVKINKVSKSQVSRTRKYLKLKKAHLEKYPFCQAKVCCEGLPAVDIHHKAGRIGDNLFKHFLSVCRKCHDWIEDNPEEAKKLKLSINRLT
jgi:hypothetical protein